MDKTASELVTKLQLTLEEAAMPFRVALMVGIVEKSNDMRTNSLKADPVLMEKRLDDWDKETSKYPNDKDVQRAVKERRRDFLRLLAMVAKVVEEDEEEKIGKEHQVSEAFQNQRSIGGW